MSTPNDSVTVYNQLAANGNVSKMVVGWNNELTATKPLDKFVNPVAPVCVRSDNVHPSVATMKRRDDLGAITLILISNLWGYDFDNPPGKNNDWTDWENTVNNAVTSILSVEYACPENVYFEIWNEPNGVLDVRGISIGEGFWPYDHPYTYKEHFMDTWNHAYTKIKGIDSDIKVVGPCFSGYYGSDMKQYFFQPAQEDNTFPDVISYHYPFVNAFHPPYHHKVVDEVNDLADYMRSNNMSTDGIMITELYRNNYGYQLAAMQRASAENADFLQILNAFFYDETGAMGGIISWGDSHQGGYKRGDWWVLKKFVDMNEISGIMKTDRGNRVEVYAAKTFGSLGILLGSQANQNNPYTGLTRINLEDFPIQDYTYYTVYRLISNDNGEVGPPEFVEHEQLSSEFIDINWQDYDDSYYIEINLIKIVPSSTSGHTE